MSAAHALTERLPYLTISGLVLAADQLSKVLAHAQLRGRPPVSVIPGLFDLTYSRNPGGLFGSMATLGDPWRTLLLLVLPLAASLLVLLFLLSGEATDRRLLAGLSLILGGAVGNLIDRLLRGEVVDFLDVYVSAPALRDWLVRRFGTAHWPTFNVADSAIVIGAGLLIWDMLRPGHKRRPDSAERARSG